MKSVVSAHVAGSRYVPFAAVGTFVVLALPELDVLVAPEPELFLLLTTTATGIMIARRRTMTPAAIPAN